MTFATLLSNLKNFDAALPLVFEVDDQLIGAGYHVTELRHSLSTGIDCGGTIETWQEARLQLLDGPGETHMSVAKFSAILEKSLNKLPKLYDTPFLVEFSPDNLGLKLMSVSDPSLADGRVSLQLHESMAICKPENRNKSAAAPISTPQNTPQGCCT